MMRLPLTNSYITARKFSRCVFCNKRMNLRKGFAFVSGGAIENAEGKPLDFKKLDGFVDIAFHGPPGDFEAYTVLLIAKDFSQGQFEIYFCSTGCLRNFFSTLVDRLEVMAAKDAVRQQRLEKRFLRSQRKIVTAKPAKPRAKSRVKGKKGKKAL
jgi:hypothetical protein